MHSISDADILHAWENAIRYDEYDTTAKIVCW